MTLDETKSYFINLLKTLEEMPPNPWPFLCAAALIEYLTKMVNGGKGGPDKYKQFVEQYLAGVNGQYRDFAFADGKNEFSFQLYHVLRCGIVHAFSLVPDETGEKRGGRAGSIVIAHKGIHLSAYRENGRDAALLVLPDLVSDLTKVIDQIFQDAAKDPSLRKNIEAHLQKYPPIQLLPAGGASSVVLSTVPRVSG